MRGMVVRHDVEDVWPGVVGAFVMIGENRKAESEREENSDDHICLTSFPIAENLSNSLF
jgi:hypothetical protein